MSWDSWALGFPGSGNILFLRRMSSYSQPVAEVLAYLQVQISPISCNVVGSILQMCMEKTLTQHCRLPVDGGGGTPCPVLLTGAKKVWGA